MDFERELQRISERISLLRNMAIMVNLFVIATIGAFIFIPGVIDPIVKIYMISIAGFALVGITIALVLARRDSTATLFFTGLSMMTSGVFLGVAIASVQKIASGGI
jgi:hypothetical protein